jgi:hypothetical protein
VSLSLEDLKRRQQKFDETAEVEYNRVKALYPEIDSIIPVVVDPIRGVVLKKGSKPTPVEAPIEVVNAIRLRSIKHIPPPNHTCVKCEVKYDDYGYIVGVIHVYMPDEDVEVTLPDGTKTMVEGLKSKIAKGKVRVKSDYEVEVLD